MYTAITVALSLAAFSSAQSTVSLFVPGADTQPLVASVIGSDLLATTYAVQCTPGTDSSNCGFPGIFTLTEGPSTAAYTLSEGYSSGGSSILALTGYYQCSLDGLTSAICTESFSGKDANDPGMTTETMDVSFMPVTLTTGALQSNTGDEITLSGTRTSSSGSSPQSTTSTSNIASKTTSSIASRTTSSTPLGTTTGTNTGSITSITGTRTTSASSGSASSSSQGRSSSLSVSSSLSSSSGLGSSSGSSSSAASTSSRSSSTSAAGAHMVVVNKVEWIVGGAIAALAML
ncbi:hypothetical protein BGZ60DRAFT_418219 [Tricladium varicosporioides]|nr:hypothetical protein BGZ60DRAFT_418219 [Hymenoscyphus varicosporioides]